MRAGLPEPENAPYENLGNRELPVFEVKNEIKRDIRDHRITILEGPTGSGKSSQVGQYALEMGYQRIVYLEPHILQADNLADRIESELAEQLGDNVANQLIGVRHSERSPGRGKLIQVMTPGTYLRVQSELDDFDDKPTLVIGDEIHVKNFETEMAVAATVLKLSDRPKWRIVLASATMDAEAISRAYTSVNGRQIPQVSIGGRPHELQIVTEPTLTPEEVYLKYQADHQKALIFTAGKQEIADTVDRLRSMNIGNTKVTPLHAKVSTKDRGLATNMVLGENERQVIPSTNVAESGVTIAGLTLVISDGTIRRRWMDRNGVPGLYKTYSSQDELVQQGGRAGRDVGGGLVVYCKPGDPMFKYVPFENRSKQSPAEIYSTNLASSVLLAESFGVRFDKLNEMLIHSVDSRPILDAYDVLYRLGALDGLNKITEIGVAMNRFPLRPEFSRALVAAMDDKADSETMQHLAGIVSSVEAGGLPLFQKDLGREWRNDIRPESSDDYQAHLDMFYATRPFYNGGKLNESALERRNYDIQNVRRAHKSFDKIMHELGIDINHLKVLPPTDEQMEKIRGYLTAGLFDYAHIRISVDGADEYVSVHDSDGTDFRELSNRGTYKGREHIVLGLPRHYEKVHDGELQDHSSLEDVMPTSRHALASYASRVLTRESVEWTTIRDGRLVRFDNLFLGSLSVGEVESERRLPHTPDSKRKLIDAAFNKPTKTIQELTFIKKRLEWLARRVPDDELDSRFPSGLMNQDWLTRKVMSVINDEVDSIYKLDNQLRTIIVRGNTSLRTWVSETDEAAIVESSLETIEVPSGASYLLSYANGRPIINKFNLRDLESMPDDFQLPDGRTIYINYAARLDGRTKQYSAKDLKLAYKTLG